MKVTTTPVWSPGCGRASASTRTARPRTATRRRARPRWWRSLRVGDASEAFITLRVKQAKNNSLKSVVVRVVRADVHPLIAVPNYAGVRVVSGIVVGISRRETQTCACYEWHKAPTSKAGHTKTPADGGGANPWGYRGRAESGANCSCTEAGADAGDAGADTTEAAANCSCTEAGADAGDAGANTTEAATNCCRTEAGADAGDARANTTEAATNCCRTEATAYRAPTEAAALSRSRVWQQGGQEQGSSNKPKLFHGRLLRASASLKRYLPSSD